MQNLKRLQFLDLGENRIADTIPAWIGERLSDLEFLTLQTNNFHGGISNTLCQLPHLQVLNLAHNDLSGSIPHCFKNFTAMESTKPGTFEFNNSYLDPVLRNFKAGIELEYSKNLPSVKSISLSGNHLVGEIPDEIMGLVGLQTLNLSKNHLNGRIPKNIGNLKQLETLDLSMNELRGEIPPSLSSIYSLSSLNLSYNKLSGPIPSGNQLQTLNDPSIYEGNIGLCGKPLLNSCPADESPTENGPVLDDKGHSEFDFSWFYAGFGPGFSVGVVGVVGILQFKQSWRYALFKCVENAYDGIWVMIGLKTSRLRRNFH
nr:receptor-like protein EIX2 isoform X2 [Coffea arabica]